MGHQCCGGRKPLLEPVEPRLLLDGAVTDPTVLFDPNYCPLGLGQFYGGNPSAAATTTADTPSAPSTFTVSGSADTYYNFNVGLPNRVDKNNNPFVETPNTPLGTGVGIFPGRVVWVHDPTSTNSGPGQTPWTPNNSTSGPFFWDNAYTNQTVVDSMMAKGVMNLTGTTSVAAAWTALINNFNTVRGNPRTDGYRAGESIAIKCNLNTQGSTGQTDNAKKPEPQVINALLDQLVNVVGVPQNLIYIYDNLDVWSKPYWDYFNASNTADPHLRSPATRFPSVHWMDNWNGGGRNQTQLTSFGAVYYPWGVPNRTGTPQAFSFIPTYLASATYLIDLAVLSAHSNAGVTLCGKNFIGSIGESPNGSGSTSQNATVHQHVYFNDATYSGPDYGSGSNVTYYATRMGGQPRTFAQFLANQYIGQKILLNMLDGLYAGWDWGNYSGGSQSNPTKWYMQPFGNGMTPDSPDAKSAFPSSLFFSQDTVAIDSVGVDFLMTESTTGQHNLGNLMTNANYKYTDDYLHEAAQITSPPSGTSYVLTNVPWVVARGSLGTHEHWNNGFDKQYSRNLGRASGIDLVDVEPNAPHITGIQFNSAKAISTIDPDPRGVTSIAITFDQAVNVDTTHDVLVQKVTFDGNIEHVLTNVTPSSVVASGTPTVLTITLPNATQTDAWIKVTLLGQETLNGNTMVSQGIVNSGYSLMDGNPKPGGSGRGYIYSSSDLTTGDGIAGGNAVFYVGSLLADGNRDGIVDGLDYGVWQNGYRTPLPIPTTGDYNGDGSIDGLDYGVWQNEYGAALAALPTALGGSSDSFVSSDTPAPAAGSAPVVALVPTVPTAASETPVAAAPAVLAEATIASAGASAVPAITIAPPSWVNAINMTPTAGAVPATPTDASLAPDGGVDVLAAPAKVLPL
jgi:hypothetical protein